MKTNRRNFIKQTAMAGAALGFYSVPERLFSDQPEKIIKIGIIGLDTSHSPAFTEFFNADNPEPGLSGFKVVAAYPNGSADIISSVEAIPEYTKQV
jgi:hypothetical protein